MSLKRIMVLDGVTAVCRFQDDGAIMEAEGALAPELMARLAKSSQWYRRIVSGNTDVFSLLAQMDGWSPSRGWIVQGTTATVCGMGNTVCIVDQQRGSLNEVMQVLREVARD